MLFYFLPQGLAVGQTNETYPLHLLHWTAYVSIPFADVSHGMEGQTLTASEHPTVFDGLETEVGFVLEVQEALAWWRRQPRGARSRGPSGKCS